MAPGVAKYNKGMVVLAAGGTGGHLSPAQALGETLVRRGILVHLMTDARGAELGTRFPAVGIHEIPSSTITVSKPWRVPIQLWRLMNGYQKAKSIISRIEPEPPMAVVGFGGYPSIPPVLAAARLRIPVVLHEQNAVMGRANRLLSRWARAIASSFPKITNLPAATARFSFTGNPVRGVVMSHWDAPYDPPAADELFRVLIFGGSQGARFFSEFIPNVIEALPKAVRRRLRIVQQCRAEDLEGVQTRYAALGVKARLAPFFADLPKHIADAHLVICRSGASTIAELAIVGRPAIMVPLPHALDNDQLRNAQSFANAGAGWVYEEKMCDADTMASFLTRMRYAAEELTAAANAAKAFARPDAAELLADLVEHEIEQNLKDNS